MNKNLSFSCPKFLDRQPDLRFPRVCFLSGLTGEEILEVVGSFEEDSGERGNGRLTYRFFLFFFLTKLDLRNGNPILSSQVFSMSGGLG